jgi:hypothetical protein
MRVLHAQVDDSSRSSNQLMKICELAAYINETKISHAAVQLSLSLTLYSLILVSLDATLG